MKSSTEQLAQTVAALVQFLGAVVAFILLVGWAWTLAAGSVLGFVLLFLLGALFVAPLVAWGLPAVSLASGLVVALIARGVVAFKRSRA